MQLGLLILGAAVLLGIVVYTQWQVGKQRPRQAQSHSPVSGDQQEPALNHAEPDAFQALAAEPFMIPVPEKKPPLDALIDSLVPIALDAPVPGEAVLGALPPTRRVGSKPFALEGLNADSGEWEFPRAQARYAQLQAGLQLANRSGALNDIEFSEFVVKTQTFCDALGGTPDFPDMRQEVARGRELDQFAAEHDAQLSFELRARRAAWSPSYIQQMAARQGFVAGTMPGRLVLPASVEGQSSLLSLNFDTQAALSEDLDQSALRVCTLLLEVTHVAPQERAFERLRVAAAELARQMDGVLTDDRGMPLSEQALDQIGDDIAQLYGRLEEHGISAGSSLARRLFA
jgi:hypothetical protein